MHTAPRHGSRFVRKAQHSSTFVLTLPSQRYAPQATILIACKTGSQEGLISVIRSSLTTAATTAAKATLPQNEGAGGHLSILRGNTSFLNSGCQSRWLAMPITSANRLACRSRRGNNSVTDSIQDQVGDGVKVQLLHNVGTMCLCRLYRHIQCHGDFFRTLARPEQIHDLTFASRQTDHRRRRCVHSTMRTQACIHDKVTKSG